MTEKLQIKATNIHSGQTVAYIIDNDDQFGAQNGYNENGRWLDPQNYILEIQQPYLVISANAENITAKVASIFQNLKLAWISLTTFSCLMNHKK